LPSTKVLRAPTLGIPTHVMTGVPKKAKRKVKKIDK